MSTRSQRSPSAPLNRKRANCEAEAGIATKMSKADDAAGDSALIDSLREMNRLLEERLSCQIATLTEPLKKLSEDMACNSNEIRRQGEAIVSLEQKMVIVADLERRIEALEHRPLADADSRPGGLAAGRVRWRGRPPQEVKRIGAKNGAEPPGRIKASSKSVKVVRMMVSNLEADTAAQDVAQHLKEAGVTPLAVLKLRTRFRTYSSFCIEIHQEHRDDLMRDDLWAEGTLLKEYRGKPWPDQIVEEIREEATRTPDA